LRIRFERTGGVGGMRLACEVSPAALPGDDGRRLTALVDASGFFDLPATLQTFGPGGDRFEYLLAIEDGRRAHTVRVNETALTEGLRPLVAWLTAFARRPA
jgi:hypothetical protein